MQRHTLKNHFICRQQNKLNMRNFRILSVMVLAAVLVTSCTKNELNNISIAEAQSILPGSYKVNDFAGTGDLAQYQDYTFEFLNSGELVATKGAETYTGSWSLVSINTDPVYDREVTITIDGNEEMTALNHRWYVKNMTDVTLNLIDDAASSEILFIKI